MAPATRIFDPDGDLTFILPSGSSMHTLLASPVLKAMLTGNLAEAVALRDNGKVEIPLSEDNAIALTILMDIIHSRHRKVPSPVLLKLLALLAVAVDDALKDSINDVEIPKGDNALLLWLSISWVFRTAAEIELVARQWLRNSTDLDATRDIEIQGTDPILPVPSTALSNRPMSSRDCARLKIRMQCESSGKLLCALFSREAEVQVREYTCGRSSLPGREHGDALVELPIFRCDDPGARYAGVSVRWLIHAVGNLQLLSSCHDYHYLRNDSAPSRRTQGLAESRDG
ncbi:hypothetical protein JHW43_007562 [Diplocarpon mali]|nr:hypothetical protein JHW43_007562 [Diplocarpon mali]